MPAPASALRSETDTLPEGRADEGACPGKRRSRGAMFHLHSGTNCGRQRQQPTWRQVPGLPGNQGLLPGLSADPKGSSLLKADHKERNQEREQCR